jgi:hypothetical protein
MTGHTSRGLLDPTAHGWQLLDSRAIALGLKDRIEKQRVSSTTASLAPAL